MFDPWDLTYGPLNTIPYGPNKFDVPCYRDPKDSFENVKTMKRKKLFDEF